MGLLWETANSSVLLKPKVLKGSHQLKILYYVDLLEFVNLCSREQREESKTRRWLILLCRYLQDFSVYPPFCSSLAFLSSYLLGKLFWEKAGEETFPFGWNHYHLISTCYLGGVFFGEGGSVVGLPFLLFVSRRRTESSFIYPSKDLCIVENPNNSSWLLQDRRRLFTGSIRSSGETAYRHCLFS